MKIRIGIKTSNIDETFSNEHQKDNELLEFKVKNFRYYPAQKVKRGPADYGHKPCYYLIVPECNLEHDEYKFSSKDLPEYKALGHQDDSIEYCFNDATIHIKDYENQYYNELQASLESQKYKSTIVHDGKKFLLGDEMLMNKAGIYFLKNYHTIGSDDEEEKISNNENNEQEQSKIYSKSIIRQLREQRKSK